MSLDVYGGETGEQEWESLPRSKIQLQPTDQPLPVFTSETSSSCEQTCPGVSEKQQWKNIELLYNTEHMFASNFIISFDKLSTLIMSVGSVLCACDSHFVFLLCLCSLPFRPWHEPFWHGNWKHHCSSPWCSTSSHSSCLQSQTSGPWISSWRCCCQSNSQIWAFCENATNIKSRTY